MQAESDDSWKQQLSQYETDSGLVDDQIALKLCQLAYDAHRLRTYAVGAVITDKAGSILVEAHNRVYVDGRSDLHAEMVALNEYESNNKLPDPDQIVLYTSLEPCLMCTGRIILSKISEIVYLANDKDGGMVTRLHNIPALFKEFSKNYGQSWRQGECSEQLRVFAHDIWNTSRPSRDG